MSRDWKVGTTYHAHVSLKGALHWPKAKLKHLLVDEHGRRLTADEAITSIARMIARGLTALPMGCPTPNPDGTCPGHRTDGEAP